MALIFQRNITPDLVDVAAFSEYLSADATLGGLFDSVIWYRPSEDLIRLKFTQDLTEDQIVHLDGLITSYSETFPSDVKIYRLMSDTERTIFGDYKTPPIGWNYRTGLESRLHFRDTKNYGRIQEREYYLNRTINPDGTVTLDDKIIREEYQYTFNDFGDVIERTIVIHWVREDGSEHPTTKSHTKNYLVNLEEMLDEAIKVRQAFTNELKIVVRAFAVPSIISNGQLTQEATDLAGGDPGSGPYSQTAAVQTLAGELLAIALLEDYEDQISSFISIGSPKIITAFATDSTHVWLDNEYQPAMTFRQHLVSEITTYIQGGA